MKPELSKFNIDEIRQSVAMVTGDCKLTPVQCSKFHLINSALAELVETIGELKCNCMNCDHPWRKGANEVYCFMKDDEFHEHALVISDPKHHTCSNHKPQGKRKPYCGYNWGCKMNIDGKCTHSETCRCQVGENGRTLEEEAKLAQTEKDEENERLEYERLKAKFEGGE